MKSKTKEQLQDLWGTTKRNNISVIGIPEEKDEGTESIFKAIWAANF